MSNLNWFKSPGYIRTHSRCKKYLHKWPKYIKIINEQSQLKWIFCGFLMKQSVFLLPVTQASLQIINAFHNLHVRI